jgi:hypothetical protein
LSERALKQQPTRKKKPPRKSDGRRPPILPTALYDRRAAAAVAGCSEITLIRAHDAGYLNAYRQGRYVKHSGQHLIDWLESGGKTGWSKKKGDEHESTTANLETRVRRGYQPQNDEAGYPPKDSPA